MRVDVQKSDMRRPECRTSKLCIAKSISIEARGVDRAIAHGRRLELPQEIWPVVVATRLGESRGNPNAGQKSAEGIVVAQAVKARTNWSGD